MEQQSSNLFDLHIDPQSQSFLSETAKWAKFISIAGIILLSLGILAVALGGFNTLNTLETFDGGGYGSSIMTTYLIVMVVLMIVFILFYVYLYRFAVRMQVALRNNDQATLTSSFSALKSCFKFAGIVLIIVLAVYLILFLVGIAAVAMSGI